MKKSIVIFMFLTMCISGYPKDSPFFLSSESIMQQKQGSLKDLHSFTFVPLVKMEGKQAEKSIDYMKQALKSVGKVVEKPVSTSEGADLETFSNPVLQFSLVQLVDPNNALLPVLQIELSISAVVEFTNNKELASISTNCWSLYVQKTGDVYKVIQDAFPKVLKLFILDFQRANPGAEKPTFYINYDKSWWHSDEK